MVLFTCPLSRRFSSIIKLKLDLSGNACVRSSKKFVDTNISVLTSQKHPCTKLNWAFLWNLQWYEIQYANMTILNNITSSKRHNGTSNASEIFQASGFYTSKQFFNTSIELSQLHARFTTVVLLECSNALLGANNSRHTNPVKNSLSLLFECIRVHTLILFPSRIPVRHFTLETKR